MTSAIWSICPPSGVGQSGREHVVGAREVEAAVGEHHRRGGLVAPLMHGDDAAVAWQRVVDYHPRHILDRLDVKRDPNRVAHAGAFALQ